jgi:hypothetical protein
MSKTKGQVRAIRKVQKETAKALAKEQEKLRKAIEKAAAKVIKEQEKQRIKAEAKAERELNKRIKKMGGLIGTVNPDDLPAGCTPELEETCTSTSKANEEHSGPLAFTSQSSTDKYLSPSLTTPVPEMPPVESTTSTEETTKPVVGTTLTVLSFEEEKPKFRTFDLPMEKK